MNRLLLARLARARRTARVNVRGRGLLVLAALTVCAAFAAAPDSAAASGKGQPTDWNRFYHYPYVYYPRNFKAPVEYDSLYYKYPVERRIPVYRTDWHNFYPRNRPYHSGHHFLLDVF